MKWQDFKYEKCLYLEGIRGIYKIVMLKFKQIIKLRKKILLRTILSQLQNRQDYTNAKDINSN